MLTMGEDQVIADELLAVPIETAARLAEVSARQLRYWDQTGLVVPSIKAPIGQRTTGRLYRFDNLIELLVVATMLRSRGVTLQHVRKVVEYLRSRGYLAPLRELRYAVAGGEVFFQDERGNWAGGRAPDQLVEHRVLPLEGIRARIRQAQNQRRGRRGRDNAQAPWTYLLGCRSGRTGGRR
jgi:DNA-binding transcriptional MerR regulator